MRYDDRNTYRRRKIGDALRRFREERGLTQGAAGRLLERSQASLSSYENGHRAIRPRDLKHILDSYGVTDELVRTRLLSLAGHGRQDGWWHDFEERLEPGVLDHAALEAETSRIRAFQPHLVYGLLQTPEYARAVISGSGTRLRSPRDIETAIDFRLGRQRIHDQKPPPRISVVLGEAALHLEIGGPEVMQHQRAKLLAISELSHIELQILPFAAGAHPGVDGAFIILSSGPGQLLEVVSVHSLARSWYVDEPSDVDLYAETFRRLQEMALSEHDSRARIERIGSLA
ncbi:helix-turn-helix domain-containing protein [Spirillospora sp. NPDC048911]|uniref:helix-turn-helix domain-containing protein n=1 Tax=Spirillospora sp. NPDC048911 TaxID=3364527 RepID=UPI0037218D1A